MNVEPSCMGIVEGAEPYLGFLNISQDMVAAGEPIQASYYKQGAAALRMGYRFAQFGAMRVIAVVTFHVDFAQPGGVTGRILFDCCLLSRNSPALLLLSFGADSHVSDDSFH